MQLVISEFSEADQCHWCNRNVEGVTVEFEQGFLARGHLCWKCLQRSTRVYATQNGGIKKKTGSEKATKAADKS